MHAAVEGATGEDEEEDRKVAGKVAGAFSLNEALQSLAADLGELWSDDDDSDHDDDINPASVCLFINGSLGEPMVMLRRILWKRWTAGRS